MKRQAPTILRTIPVGRFSRAAALFLLLLALTIPVRAQASQDLDQCIKGVDGNPDDVIQSCTAAIDSREVTGPNLRAVLNNRGIAYKNKGDSVHAAADFSQAIHLNPNDDKALNNRGALYMNEGDY